ncbi:MAG TPA: acylneuraminate cytidylyltransferase family protein [Kofleriaceae bacterium]|jgi:CMP-N-acetylneuraminic acid synthetase
MSVTAIALVPARAGSKRVPGKNQRTLADHPLLAYTVTAALESGVFASVVVSTDSEQIAEIARYYGAETPLLRPRELAEDLSPDIEWVEHVLLALRTQGHEYDAFSILRATNPFRQAATIRRAWAEFLDERGVDSLRAVERCKQHPGKMWVVRGRRMQPLLPVQPEVQPWHSTPYQALPEIYVQSAALEIAWSRVVWQGHTIAGTTIMPFFMSETESVDINDPTDWARAERYAATPGTLPMISKTPFSGSAS